MRLESCGKTDKGKVRENNEDNFFSDNEKGIFIVADGMGGHGYGEVASETTVKAIEEFFNKNPISEISKENIEEYLKTAVLFANNKLLKKQMQYENMNSTVVFAIADKSGFHLCHVGDSRAYLINKKEIRQLTEDHSVVMEMVKKGMIKKEEARKHPLKNRLLQGVGSKEIKPDYNYCNVKKDDKILLCSDGLWDMLEDYEIKNIVNQDKKVSEICNELIKDANEKGGEDNITVVLVRVKEIIAKKLPRKEKRR